MPIAPRTNFPVGTQGPRPETPGIPLGKEPGMFGEWFSTPENPNEESNVCGFRTRLGQALERAYKRQNPDRLLPGVRKCTKGGCMIIEGTILAVDHESIWYDTDSMLWFGEYEIDRQTETSYETVDPWTVRITATTTRSMCAWISVKGTYDYYIYWRSWCESKECLAYPFEEEYIAGGPAKLLRGFFDDIFEIEFSYSETETWLEALPYDPTGSGPVDIRIDGGTWPDQPSLTTAGFPRTDTTPRAQIGGGIAECILNFFSCGSTQDPRLASPRGVNVRHRRANEGGTPTTRPQYNAEADAGAL